MIYIDVFDKVLYNWNVKSKIITMDLKTLKDIKNQLIEYKLHLYFLEKAIKQQIQEVMEGDAGKWSARYKEALIDNVKFLSYLMIL